MNWYPNRCFASQVYGSQTADNSSDCVIAVVLVYVREAEHKIYDVNTLTNIGARWISRIARTVSGSPGHNSLGSGVPFLPVFMRPCLSSFPFRLPPVSYTRGRCPVSSPLSPSSLSPVGACPLCNLTHTSAFTVLVLHVTFQPRSAARDALMCGSSSLVDICTICVSADNHSHSRAVPVSMLGYRLTSICLNQHTYHAACSLFVSSLRSDADST